MRRAVKETYDQLRANPSMALSELSDAELDYLMDNPGMGQANFGKALERAVARHPDVKPYFMQVGGASMPDFVGLPNLEMYEITTDTLAQMIKHFARSYVNPMTYITYPSVPYGFGVF